MIIATWVNDNWCDCGNCEDEFGTEWNCSNCECTQNCTTYSYCPGGQDTTEPQSTAPSSWACDDGCEIPGFVFCFFFK